MTTNPVVTVYIASADTAVSTELAVRTVIARAGMMHGLVVGDSGSTDGSVEMLQRLRARGWLQLDLVRERRHHFEWLDLWLATCPTQWAVFVDSDVEFRRNGWLRELLDVGRQGYALVCGEMLAAVPHSIEPVGHREVYLAPRPAPWLLLIDCHRVRGLGVSFGFVAEPSDERPEGLIAYDTGAKLFASMLAVSMPWIQMPPSYQKVYAHYGNMSWGGAFGSGRAHRAKARRARRQLRRARHITSDE